MANDKITKMYNALVKSGYNMASEDVFRQRMSDPNKRRAAYDALKKSGYNMRPYDEFEANIGYGEAETAPAQASPAPASAPASTPQATTTPEPTPEPATTPAPAQQGGWKPTEQEKIRMSYQLHTMMNDFNQRSRERIAQTKRMTERMTPEGRKKLKAAQFQAQLAGTPTKVMGLTPDVSVAPADGQQATAEGADAPKPLLSGQSPVPYGVVIENGERKTQWLLPDGRLTTSLIEADQAEFGARRVRLMNQFVGRMKENGLDPAKQEDVQKQAQLDYEAPMRKVLNSVWAQAEEEDRAADEEYRREMEEYNKTFRSNVRAFDPSGMPLPTPEENLRDFNRAVKRKETFNLESMANTVLNNLPASYRQQSLQAYQQYFTAHTNELNGRSVQQAAQDALRSEVYNAVYQRAVDSRMPKSKMEFLIRKIADQPLLSSYQAMDMAAASMANSWGMNAAEIDAMSQYGSQHRALDITGTVLNMAIDPTTYISGGVGSFIGKQGIKIAGKRMIKGATKEVAERYAARTLTGRVIGGMAGGAANFATFEALKNVQSQMAVGGVVNPETGEREFSFGEVLKAGGHGLVLGGVTGSLSPIIGNVADKYVKATSSTGGKMAIRSGELVTSTLAEGTIFSAYDIYENSKLADDDPNKRSNFDIWSDSMAMMLGFKVSHMVKSAPSYVASLRPIKPTDGRPLTQAERRHNRMNFEERLRKRMDACPRELDFTKEERDELRRAGYGELADLFTRREKGTEATPEAKPEDGAIDFQRVEAEEVREPSEFDGYDAMERLMQDGRVSQAARAKAYFILTDRMLPMGSVTGYTTQQAEDGTFIVNSVTADGEVVTSRVFADEAKAQTEINNINRQAELNTIDVGERYRDAEANERVFMAAVNEVARGADPTAIRQIYEAVKRGDENVTESQRQLAEFLDEAIQRNAKAGENVRPEAIRERLNKESGLDVDKALRKSPQDRTAEEQALVERYARELFPEQAQQREQYQPTPEEAEADNIYAESHLLYGRFEQGDPTAQAEIDAIALRMQEAYQMCEDAFGAEAEYWMYHVNENPWSLIHDNALTPDQQEAVLYYINSKAALDGVMDASHEASQRKREQVEQEVAGRTHKERGVIIPAVLKVDDKPAYIVKGDVVMYPDGSGVDVTNSSESIVIMDESGEYKFVSPDQIYKVGESIDPQDELQTAYNQIDAEQQSIFGVDVPPEPEAPAEPAPEHTPEPAPGPETPSRPIADTKEYDQGYEWGIEAGPKYTDEELASNIAKLRENATDAADNIRGMLEALEYEQQRRAMEAQSVPETPESVLNPTENAVSEGEIVPETVPSVENGQQTALSRIPIDEATQEPQFTAVDPETAWDGLVEAMEGEANALPIAQQMIEDANKRLEALNKKPPTPAKPKLAGKAGPMAMRAEQKRVDEANALAQAEYQQSLANAQAELQAWGNILNVYNSRNAELRRQQEEARRQRDAEAHDAAVARFEEEQRIKAEKQAEQERIGVHAVNPKIREKWESAPKVEGNEDALTLPDGSTISGRYVLTEAGAASPSHDANNAYIPTEGFPIDENGQSVNDRDYERDKDAQRIVEQIAGAYDNRALQDPVIVSKDGVVLSGNNRTMSGDLAARQGTDKAYNDYLAQFGHKKYGFTPEQVQSMNNPRVVFVPDEALPYDATTFARFNAQEKKSQGKPEAAVKLGKIVPDNVFTNIVNDISRYDRLSDYYTDEKAVAHALGALMQAGVINDKQMPELRTGTAISAGGKELIENTLIGKVFQASPDAVRQIISVPTLRQSIVMGLSEIANNRTLSNSGYDLADELAKAVDLVQRAKASSPDIYVEGMPVSPFGRMAGLFDDEFGDSRVTDATTLLLADILNSGKPSDLRKVLATYNNEASSSASGQADIFTGEVASKEDILTTVNEHFRNATPKEQQALVDNAISERKRRAAEEQQQRDGSEAGEQTADAIQRGAEPQQLNEPTEAQKAAGNYKMEHRKVDGYNVSIENPKGSVRRGKGEDGKEWQTTMQNDYGYIRGTEGVDGDHIDVFLSDTPEQGDVFVIDQVDKDGNFDEHKVMYGFPSVEAAREAYLSNYEQGWTGLGAITHVSKDEFKKWIGSSKRKTKPFADYKSVKPIEDNSIVGRSLSEQEATDLIAQMEANAEVAPAIELTPDNWIAQFGEDGTVDTPLGTVKMGANQLLKLYSLKRTEYFGMIYPTLNSPDVIMEKHAPADGAERDSKYLFVKTFIKSDGSRLVHFESVTVKRDGMEVSISSHEAEGKAIKKEMQNSKILHLSESLSLSSERYLTEAPTETEGPDLVPTSDNVSSDGKVNTLSADKQADSVESSEPYTITPAVYVGKSRGNKPGKETPMHRVTFNRPLTEEQERAVKAFANEAIGEKKGRFATKRGWADREAADGSWLFRTEEDARKAGEMIGNEEAVADAQPLSREDLKQAAMPAEKPARKKPTPKPANTATIEDITEPTEQKKVDYKEGDVVELTTGDHFVIRHIRPDGTMHGRYVQSKLHGNDVSGLRPEKIKRVVETSEDKPAPADKPKGQFKVTDEMKAQEDELRKLLGIDDDEGSSDSYFRDPDELTPEQKRKVFSLGVNYAFNFLDNGVTTFPDFAKAVVGRLGSKVKPFIKSWYEGAKRVPGYGGEGYTDSTDVDRFDIENFDKPSPDAIRDAEMRVAERKAKQAAEQAEKELIAERNEQRKKDEQQTAADTATLAEKAEAVASEAESHASLAGGRKPERKTILRDLKRIDDTLDEVNSQLALLGYYEAEEVDKDFNEAYGYMRNAEKKAVSNAVELTKQLVKDLGIDLKVTSSTTAKRGKKSTIVSANVAPAGGDVTITIPLAEGRELKLYIGLEPADQEEGEAHNRPYYRDDLYVNGIMYRVENPNGTGHERYGSNQWANSNVTYSDLLKAVQREAYKYLPEQTPQEGVYKSGEAVQYSADGGKTWTDSKIVEVGDDGMIKLDTGLAPVLYVNATSEQVRRKPATPTPTEDIFGEAQRKAEEYKQARDSKQKKSIKPEQQVGDLFGGLFDEPISTTTDEKKTDVQPRPGSAKRERGHQPQPNDTLGESQRNEVKGTDGRGMDRRDSVNPDSDGERGAGVSRKPASQEPLERLPDTERKNSNNNHAERGTDYAPKGEDARIKANIEAIQLAKQLLDAGEQATPEQMAVLRRFSGWGGLGKAFNEDNAVARQLRQLLTEDEYKTAIDSRNSAYYTPAEVIDTMWDVVRAMGFKGGNVLEGSAGIGNILGLMPTDFSERSNIHAVEVDHLTGGILSLLYPDAKVDIQGFEDTKVRNNSVDLAITNVPFITDWHVMDKTGDKDLSKKFRDIHDFCIAKNIRKLREGGIGIFITSSGTMDNSARLRQWITSDGNADVVGAFRMHNKTFGGTGATSDIIVVRKRVNGKPSPNAINIADVTGLRTADYDTGDTRKVAGQVVPIIKSMPIEFNKYFVEHPENMAGEMMFNFERGETRYPTSKSLFPTAGKDQSAMLKEWAGKFADMKAEDETVTVEDAMTRINEKLGEDVKEGSMVLNSNGELCVARMGEAEPIKVNKNKVKGHTKAECFQAYTAIKKALKDVLDYQSSHDDDAGLTPLLKELNRAFDSFTRTYGNLHKNTAISFLRNDVDFSSILALETYSEKGDKKGNKVVKVGKTDIFSRRVIETEKEPQPDNIKDGILASLYKSGGVDVDYIAEALGKTPDDVRKEIVESGLGFENPATGVMEVSYQYLSGNVRDKLHIAEENNEDGRYDANIKALQHALPMTIPAHLIEFSLGSSWIDHRLYEAFVEEKTGVKVGLTNAGGTWFMKRPWSTFTEKNRAMGVVSKMCGKTIMGDELIEAAITNKTITVSKTERHYDGSTETITDSEATRLCATKVDEIRAEFKDWARARMQTDSNLAETIERTYNEQFNNYVPMSIPEEFVPTHFGGQVSELHGRPFALRPHQSRAVVRAMTQPVLLAHEVGTGKTFTLITTAMEMRRLGTARKPMIVVQNATVGQFVESAKEIYPNAKVLTIEEADRTADGRRNFYAKIKYNDWDMIVVPQSVFERIPDSEEREMAYVKSIIDEKVKVLEAMKDADSQGKSMIVRQAEKDLDDSRARLSELTEALQTKRAKRDAKREAKTKQNAEVKALEMLDREVDDVENFDDMGIDAILVDEAHEYKHLGFATAMQRGVKGVDPSFSKKSQGVYLKAQAVLEHNNGRNVVFATGTPISNTAAEIWTFMRYLMPADTMKAYGIYYFDDFVRNFGNISQMVEFTTSGKFKENNRFAGYINLPELVRIWSSVADTVLTREAGGVSDKIPDIEGGKPTDIYLPQTRALRSIMKYVNEELKKYDEMTGKEKKENSHIPLVMYGIAKAAAVDARLVLSDAPDEPNSKTNATVRETLRSLKDSAKYKGTVAIFADNYQNKQSGFNLYEDIRAKLIDEGVPAEQIVIIKSGMTVKKKLDIFEKVNAGEIRVIMGSTFTLGTGVNIQERLHTLIHVDAPNRPMDYTQRNGRGARQGNLHKDMGIPIRILRFGVEDSLDVTAYQRLKTKGAIADSIMNGSKMMKNSMENRVLEEEEDVFGDMTAQLSGSEYAILKNQAERDVRSLTAKQKQHEVDQIYIHNKLPEIEGFIRGAERRIEIETSNLKAIAEHWPDGKINKITIGKMSFDSVVQMEDFFKEQNAKLNKAAEEMKQGGDEYTSTLPINIDGMEFVVTSSVKPKVTGAGQLSLDLERSVSYSCPTLGIENFSPSGQRLKAVMQDIEQNIATGERSKGLLSRGQSQLSKYSDERTQLEARKGKEFPFSKELAEAKTRLAEYEEAMKKEMAEKEAKYAELDKSVEAASDLSLSDEDSEDSDKSMLRPMEEGEPDTEMLESLTDDELVPVFRNVQVLPGMTAIASPMAAKDLTTGAYRTIAPRQWNGSYSDVQLTEEQQRMYDELAENGYVMIDGKKRTRFDISPERYFEARATKEPALMFKLDKGVDGIVPASENPYDHGKFNTLNLQFATAHKRPNLVMVQSVMPKSELRKMMANDEIAEGMYHAPYAKNSTGVVSWTNGDKLALSRWSKIIRVLTNQEVAERINALWQKNPAKSPAESADARDPFNYTPQVLERLQEMGWKFDEDKLAKLASRTPEDVEASYQGMPYVTDEDIARLNAKYADERHSSLWNKEPDEFLREAEENTMADKVQQMSERMNTPVRILRTPEEIEAYARNPREAKAKGISRIERGGSRVAEIAILLPNNKDLADVENTFLHEGMGHDGLRLLFPTEKLLNNALDELYNASNDAIKADIDARAKRMYDAEVDRIFREKQAAHESVADANSKYYTDMAEAHAEANAKREQMKRDATEEYGANVAGKVGEKGFEKMTAEEQTFWGKMKALLQQAFENLLRGLKIPKMRKWTDKQWAYIYHKAYKMKKAKGKMSVIDEAEDLTMRRKTGYDADEKSMYRDPDMSLEETITKMKAEAMQANADNLQAKRDAMRAIGGNLNHLRQAMARQREYDITTVKSVTDLAKILMDAGLLDDMSKFETKRILGAVNNVVGKQDVSQYVQKVMDIMVDNQLRNGAGAFGKLLAIRGSHVDARGIEVQGELDPDGQRIAQVVRKSTSLPKDDIDNRIAEAINRMSSTDQAIADEATLEYAGLQIARQYVEDITESKAEEKALRDSIKQAKEDKDAGQMTDAAYKQYVESTNDAIRQNKIERAEAYQSLIEQMGDTLSASVERAKLWREAEKQRVEDIHHNANSDMEGRPTDEHHKDDRVQKMANNSFTRFLLAPLGTFDQMLRMFGKKNVRGEGYLWNRYMRGWVEATEKEYTGYRDALKVLDTKVSEIYGKKMTWGDLFAIDRKLPKASVKFWDGGEMKDHELTQGNLLYIYMADKMSDGRMKLRRMGITEDDIDNIKNFLAPKFIQLADWMQGEFLVDKRNEYNEVHKRMFGASMAAIENYFPLKILANARLENVDVADDTTDTALPATSTGSIIKRRRNNLALDVTGANAFSVILDHLQQMERWAAFAEFNRDLNTLLSYKRFRNQVMNMSSVYGGGKVLWNNFRNVCSMAAGAYRPPIAALDKAAVNIAKGVTAAKVSFRVFTALKQFLSMPAYISDSNPIYLASNIANPYGAWKWSMENLPLFEKRWKSRMAGDPRLLKSEMDWKMWRSRVVEIASRIGMSPNAFVDALTVAIGSHAIYQSRLANYKRKGYDPDIAEQRAKQDATILFNQTQQSSEGAFLSTMQVDRSWLSVLFTVFRNSSMSYTRQLYDSMRSLKRYMTPGNKALSVEFMAKQMWRDGIDPDKATANAKREYRRNIIRDLARVAVFGYVLQLAWNLGAYLPYLIMGEDDSEKDKMWDDVLNHTFFGSVEGLTGGDVMSSAGQMWLNGEGNWEYLTKDMPLASDLATILRKMPTDQASAMNDVLNLLVQSGVGVNPQSLTDIVVATMDYFGDDAQTSREFGLLMARILNCPQSQIDKLYFDELGASGDEVSRMTPSQIAERYARYKIRRGAPMTGWAYGSEEREKIMEKYRKRSNTLAKERLARDTDKAVTDSLSTWNDEYKATKDRVSEINKVKERDEDRYYELLDEMEATPEFDRYQIIKDYKRDVDELTKEWLRATTPEQRDSCAKAIINLKRLMVTDLRNTQQ